MRPAEVQRKARSCTECRRRKIRCTYPLSSSQSCTRCFSRRLQCIDPKQLPTDVGEDKATLRERVSKLEATVEALLCEKRSSPGDQLASNVTTATEVDVNRATPSSTVATSRSEAPILSVLEASGFLSGEYDASNIASTEGTISDAPSAIARLRSHHLRSSSNDSSSMFQQIQHAVCERLRSGLPPHRHMMQILSSDTAWWDQWRHKVFGSHFLNETLPVYASHAYYSEHPAELGLLVSAFGRHIESETQRYLSLVDNSVIQEDSFVTSVDGLVLLVFQVTCYLDLGDPRKAFLCNRRGQTLAQLMVSGLHALPNCF